MDRAKPERRYFRQESVFVSIYMLWAILVGSLLVFPFSFSKAHAAPLANDPLVIVSVDKTQGSSCIETFHVNIGTPQALTKQIPCPPGTLMSDITIHRSQAIAQHETYIVLPSSRASAAIQQQVSQQVRQLHASIQAAMRQQSHKYAIPTTHCGQEGSASLTWNFDGGRLNAAISFFKTNNCSIASFDDSQLNTTVGLSDWYTWNFDRYAGHQWDTNICALVTNVGHYFHLVSQEAPVGYYYENTLGSQDGPNCFPNGFQYIWDNIGPINWCNKRQHLIAK